MSEEEKPQRSKMGKQIGGIIFVGFMFLGMAFGWYIGRLVMGLFIGMGLGFIGMAIIMAAYDKT